MTSEEAKNIIIKERDSLKANPMVKVDDCLYEAFDMAIKALEAQPCDDCVSRKSVKKQFEEVVHNNGSATEFLVRLWKLPSVQPTRPTGKWEKLPTGKWEKFVDDYNKCSNCGVIVKFHCKYKYCPNCGSEMAESEVAE